MRGIVHERERRVHVDRLRGLRVKRAGRVAHDRGQVHHGVGPGQGALPDDRIADVAHLQLRTRPAEPLGQLRLLV